MTRFGIQKGWTYSEGEGCEYKLFAPASGRHEGDCPWRAKVLRNGKRYCLIHDPVARHKRRLRQQGETPSR